VKFPQNERLNRKCFRWQKVSTVWQSANYSTGEILPHWRIENCIFSRHNFVKYYGTWFFKFFCCQHLLEIIRSLNIPPHLKHITALPC